MTRSMSLLAKDNVDYILLVTKSQEEHSLLPVPDLRSQTHYTLALDYPELKDCIDGGESAVQEML